MRLRRDCPQCLHWCTVRCTKALDSTLQEWCHAPRPPIAHGAAVLQSTAAPATEEMQQVGVINMSRSWEVVGWQAATGS